jgi:hypothetical protein
MNILAFSTCVFLFSFFAVGAASGEVFKCPAPDGSMVFTDQPCTKGFKNNNGAWVSVEEEARKERQRLESERNERQRIEREKEEEARMSAKRLEQESKQTRPSSGTAPPVSDSISMSFQDCLSRKTQIVASLNVNPRDIIPIVNTGIMTMDRICTSDGSVLITCSKPDKKMVVTKSSENRSVGCR